MSETLAFPSLDAPYGGSHAPRVLVATSRRVADEPGAGQARSVGVVVPWIGGIDREPTDKTVAGA